MRNRKTLKKILIATLVGGAAFIPASAYIFENGVLDLPEIAAHLYARENCMCIFITGFGLNECRQITSQVIPLSEIRVDEADHSVYVRVLWNHSHFQWQNAQLGCAFVQ